MTPLDARRVHRQLEQWVGQDVYVHLEVNPGAYWRNGRALLTRVHLKGSGPYRLFLELDAASGLIQVDDLTHMVLSDSLVICTGFDDQQRVARSIEVSCRPFTMHTGTSTPGSA
jgi:hypothetical protein